MKVFWIVVKTVFFDVEVLRQCLSRPDKAVVTVYASYRNEMNFLPLMRVFSFQLAFQGLIL